jgi:FtsP/CotA-like multicopper oxidase with cupredoxin domain
MQRKHTLESADEYESMPQQETQQDGGPARTAEKPLGVSRRRFLFAGAGAAAAMAAGPAVVHAQRESGASKAEPAASAVASTTATTFNQFMQPQRLYAQGGTLGLTLNAVWQPLGNPPPASIPTYNGYVTGPTLVINPGDQMQITLNNNLQTSLYQPPPYPFSADQCGHDAHTTPPKPECFTHTNLHAHGLFVSPSSVLTDGTFHCIDQGGCGTLDSGKITCSSDDVLVDIAAGSSNSYKICVPSFHGAGTYWYHSHLHGSSGYQVSSGMAGAIIIPEPPGQAIVPPQQDVVFLMQEVISGVSNGYPAVYGNLGGGGGPPQTFFYINGLKQPTIQMQAGQTQRWRFINATATPQGLTKLRLISCGTGDCPTPPPAVGSASDVLMNLIAVDGISFHGFPPQPVRAHLMGPGNRADFLINLPAGNYVLYKDSFPQDATCITSTAYVGATIGSKQVLTYINVQPSSYTEAPPTTIPGTRPFYLQPITNVDTTRTPVFFQNPGQAEFQINNQYYPNQQPPITAQLNTAEEWTLDNSTGNNTHPFHIHVNPFQIKGRTIDFETDTGGTPSGMDPTNPCNWMWMDTVALPMTQAQIINGNPTYTPCPQVTNQDSVNGQLTMRTRYLVYPGEYVIHCHILIHEDVGMMANVTIKNDSSGIGPCVPLSQPTENAVACVNRTTKPC